MSKVDTPGIGTITLNVRDVNRSVGFYEGVLGLPRERSEGELVWLRTRRSGDNVPLLLLHPWEKPEPTEYGISLEFEVDSVDEAVRAVAVLGCRVTRTPVDTEYGRREATVLDPDGYPVWLVQPL